MGYKDTILQDSPLVYYPLDDVSGSVMTDHSGNNRHGAYGASATLNQAPVLPNGLGRAMKGLLTASGPPPGSLAYAAWMNVANPTIECWVTPHSIPTGSAYNMVFARDTNGTDGPWRLWIKQNGTAEFLFWTSTQSYTIAMPGGTFVAGAKHHVVASYDAAGVARIYVNGVLKGTSTTGATNPLRTSTAILAVGAYGHASSSRTDCTIDEFAMYGSPLSIERISAHYTAGTTDPLAAVTNLAQTASTDDSVTLEWDPPASGPAQTGYAYSINNGAWKDIDNSGTVTIPTLWNNWPYDIRIRARNATDVGDPVLIVATTGGGGSGGIKIYLGPTLAELAVGGVMVNAAYLGSDSLVAPGGSTPGTGIDTSLRNQLRWQGPAVTTSVPAGNSAALVAAVQAANGSNGDSPTTHHLVNLAAGTYEGQVDLGSGSTEWVAVRGATDNPEDTVIQSGVQNLGTFVSRAGGIHLENLTLRAYSGNGTNSPSYALHTMNTKMVVAVNCVFDTEDSAAWASGGTVGNSGLVGTDGVGGTTMVFYHCRFKKRPTGIPWDTNLHGIVPWDTPPTEPMTVIFVDCTFDEGTNLIFEATGAADGRTDKFYVIDCAGVRSISGENATYGAAYNKTEVFTDDHCPVTGAVAVTRDHNTWPVPVNGLSAYWDGIY